MSLRGFRPGNKYGMGRRKGSLNKKPIARLEAFEESLTQLLGMTPEKYIVNQLDMMDDPKDRAMVVVKLLEFVKPKRRSIDVKDKTNELTEEDLKRLADERELMQKGLLEQS